MLETSFPALNSALQRARATVAPPDTDALAGDRLEVARAEAISRYVRAWETGDFDAFVSMLTEDAILSMPLWLYGLDGRDAVAASLRSPATWDGQPRPGRYAWCPRR